MGCSISGSEESIRSLTRNALTEYINTHYTAPRMVVAGTGAINHEYLCASAAPAFGSLLPTAPKGALEVAVDPAMFTGSDSR